MIDIEKIYLNLFIKHFNLENETAESLSKKLNIKKETKNRIVFTKTDEFIKQTKIDALGYGVNEAIMDALRKYADEDALHKYIKEEGYKYNDMFTGNLMNVYATKFIMYPNSDDEIVHKNLKKLSRYNYWEFEDVNNEYKIAYD